jgi:hypothetical protein
VKRSLARLVAFTTVLALSTGALAECAGWQGTPEARMACCAAGDDCPMHRAAQGSGSAATISQADADSCCASSDANQTPLSVAFAMALPPAPLAHPLFALAAPSALALDFVRESVPLARSPVPKHLLLSVFLI